MVKLLIGTDWVANSDRIMEMLAQDVAKKLPGRILIVPELISHDTERRLCTQAGNTSSRFADVLTFTRLARRVSETLGRGIPPCMDDGGRVVAMASAARQLHSKLKAYAAVETKPEFLTGLVDAVDEFKRCCITPEDLQRASQNSEGSFAQKLEELSLLLQTYDAICANSKSDPRDQMNWLLEQLEDSDFAQSRTFYIDGFPDFTRQHMAIVAYLMENAQNVIISINCDRIDSDDPAFEKAGSTSKDILRFASSACIPVEIQTVPPREDRIQTICSKLFRGKVEKSTEAASALRLYQTESIYEECTAAAEQIMDLVQQGVRYRDIGVACSDMLVYKNALSMIFGRFQIPFYASGSDTILEKSVISTVLAALDTVAGGFEQEDVLRYLKSPLSVLDIATSDKLENYAIIWGITGKTWLKDWQAHPGGLGMQWCDSDILYLQELNNARKAALEPLAVMDSLMRSAQNLGQMITAVYNCLDALRLSERLESMAEYMDSQGDNRSAQILNQLWEILLGALEQLYDVLGDTAWDRDTFSRLLKLLLSQYTVGTIPTALDTVSIGPVTSMRCQREKYLFILGVAEGAFPRYGGISGVLTDQERTALRQMGVPLTGGALDGLKTEFSEIYGVFRGAQEQITVSCPSGQPSFIYRRLCDLVETEFPVEDIVGPARRNVLDAASFLLQNSGEAYAAELDITKTYEALKERTTHQLGQVQFGTVESLYGKQWQLSASQVDKFADCHLAYYLKYGLRAKERKAAQVDPAEFGTYVHAVLEKTAREVVKLGGFPKVSLEKTMELASQYSREYIQEQFSQLDSSRSGYLFQRNIVELELIVQELWEELQQSGFQPIAFELAFGKGCDVDPIPIEGTKIQAQLRGFVDRVDAWKDNGQNYFRVVDYKTGKKDFDYCDVFNGLGLQMLLYMFALSRMGQDVLGENPVPAGVQYFPARVPLVNADSSLSQEEAAKAREKLWKRKGLLLHDEQVLYAMEPSRNPVRLCCTMKKDGTITGDLAERPQLKLLEKFVMRLLEKMVDQIASGDVQPNPYTRGGSHNACAFCPFGAICCPEQVEGRRNYKAMSAQRFWDEVEKEVQNRV